MKTLITFIVSILFIVGCLILIAGCADNPVNTTKTIKNDSIALQITVTDIYSQTAVYKCQKISYYQIDGMYILDIEIDSHVYPIDNIQSFTIISR